MKVAIIGCGLIGQKRLRALDSRHELVGVFDTAVERARGLAAQRKEARVFAGWREAVSDKDVEAVIVATTNNVLAEITYAACTAGKNVLVEKPAARKPSELEEVIQIAAEKNVTVQVGFNHRFHPALWKAKEIVDSGALGELMFIRGRYGQGGRVGYEKEWRANPEIAGGGELLDQGCHLIDLSRWFLGEFTKVDGHVATYFWNMPVEDNGFLSLRTEKGQTAWLHASCTEWKNMFSFEIYGKHGKLAIDGLGGSYGVERLAYYKMLPQMGPPETTIYEYPGEDTSWKLEFEAFEKAVAQNMPALAGLNDALAALKIIHQLY